MNFIFYSVLSLMIVISGCATQPVQNPSGTTPSANVQPEQMSANETKKAPARKTKLTKGSIMKSYLSGVNKADGVNKDEAILMAQSQIIFRGNDRRYNLNNPEIAFENDQSFGIKFISVKKFLSSKEYPPVVIAIDKKDGRVRFYTNPPGVILKKETIEYKDGDTVLEGYLVYDESNAQKRPGIIVVHEWKGLNDYAKKRAEQLAQLGYVAFAIDMYGKGVRPETNDEAAKQAAIYKDDRQLMRHRAQAGLEVLKNQPLVDAEKIAAIGYCLGGTSALELARSGAELKGVVSFHGGLETPLPEDAKNIKGKVLALHGADDPYVPVKEADGFEEEMKNASVDYQLIRYPNAVHGFTNPENGNDPTKGVAYNEEADQKSWEEMKDFLQKIFL